MNKKISTPFALAVIAVLAAFFGGIFWWDYQNDKNGFANSLETEPQPCTLEAKICPDGSPVGRIGSNCEFTPCPGEKNIDSTLCGKKVEGKGWCDAYFEGYEFDAGLNQCVKKGVSGCSYETPFKTMEECNSSCEKNISDDKQNWKTYRNEEYGFEIKYPVEWEFNEHVDKNEITIQKDKMSPTLVIQTTGRKYSDVILEKQEEFDKYKKENSDLDQPTGEIKDTIFADNPAKEFLYYSAIGFVEKVIVVQNDNQTITITSYEGSILDPILSTFKFIRK